MARPKKTADTRRDYQVIFRLAAEEHDLLCGKAARAGIPPNELARRLVLKRQGKLVIQVSRRCDPAFLKRLDRIGHNLNQLVKNAHIFGRVSPHVAQLCAMIERMTDETLKDAPGGPDDGS